MRSILITDCLQKDFVGPIGRFEPLPNALHVGHEESRRLLGPKPEEGPVARVSELRSGGELDRWPVGAQHQRAGALCRRHRPCWHHRRLLAAWLRGGGADAASAISLVRQVRSPRAVETRVQEEAIAAFLPPAASLADSA